MGVLGWGWQEAWVQGWGVGGMCVGVGNGWGWGMHACRGLTICTRLAMQEPRSGPCSSTLGTPGCSGESR